MVFFGIALLMLVPGDLYVASVEPQPDAYFSMGKLIGLRRGGTVRFSRPLLNDDDRELIRSQLWKSPPAFGFVRYSLSMTYRRDWIEWESLEYSE